MHILPANKLLIYLFLLISFLILSCNIKGQEANVILEPKDILIGEHAEMQISVEVPADAHVAFPAFTDTINKDIEIIRYGKIDTTYPEDGARKILNQTHIITSWEEGHFPVKPIEFKSIIEEDTTAFYSDALLLSVETLEVDLEGEIKDIKPVINIPYTFREAFPYILLFFLIVAIVLLIIYYLRKRKHKLKPAPQSEWDKPGVPAHVAALNNLESLRNKNYLREEKFKSFHSELTDIIRNYIDKRYGIDAPEMTSDEILNATKNILKEQENNLLKEILVLSDLVKFAKHKPLINDSERLLKNAFELVKNTMETSSETNKKSN